MRLRVISAIALVVVAATASGDIVTSFDFTGNRGKATSEPAKFTAPQLTVTDLIRGGGLTTGTGAAKDFDSFVAKGWDGPQPNDFLSFTVTPASGYTLNLDSLVMGVVGDRADRTLVLRSSLDGFTANLGSVGFSTTPVNRTMTLSSPLSFSDSVTFRFITLGATDDGKSFSLTSLNTASGTRAAGLVLNGSVAAVPEPTSTLLLALTGLAAVGTGAWRKRRS